MSDIFPAKWAIGPPAPSWLSYIARILMAAVLILVSHWVFAYLGGVALDPVSDGKGGNDTGHLFNYHPILMTLGFGVFMSEAIITYQAPLVSGISRPARKLVHMTLHILAAISIIMGLLAAFKSHSLKLPVPIPDLYSPHSFLGLTAVTFVAVQVLVAFASYVYPKTSLSHRMALGPVHRFLGMSTWIMGVAAMATGIQEKVTFIQMGKALSGVDLYSNLVRIPAIILVLLPLLAMAVLYHQAPSAAASTSASEHYLKESLLENNGVGSAVLAVSSRDGTHARSNHGRRSVEQNEDNF
ncbi:hypothetical protein CEUSTIGMA_g5350.t1 [Chlamydomonas eustigma]|uniref:Cytochrome b561 domain-containing protein n=1 Tax=Chlamydomonas eustigma TaxID=1157962 RepID=A0A250X494_9CHLO|nr:hypothetical protein CEUSTIGMA_g5350.t1 [Chlamydomonas eustigma]|eukprot:GAX77908.1 hypothetical protein CEUSTIGMA_g5350.t1 [Chlamydomonas eustigma]